MYYNVYKLTYHKSLTKNMYAIVKYPCNYSTFTSDVYSDCVAYLTNINELFKRFTLNTEQTETFLTVKHDTSETVYSIEYIK